MNLVKGVAPGDLPPPARVPVPDLHRGRHVLLPSRRLTQGIKSLIKQVILKPRNVERLPQIIAENTVLWYYNQALQSKLNHFRDIPI